MGFLERKKKHKTPDLSRYSQYYENQQSQQNSQLSSNAAANALRTYSLTAGSTTQGYHNYQKPQQLTRKGTLRTNSLTNSRLNSLNSNSGLGSYRSSSRTNSRTNSLTNGATGGVTERIIITKTQDEYGRTKSITKEIIQNFGSFEITKREIINNTNDSKPPSSKTLRNNSILSNELNSIQEIDEDFTNFDSINHNLISENNIIDEYGELKTPSSPIKSILKKSPSPPPPLPLPLPQTNEQLILVPNEELDGDEVQSDGGSIYSDAFDIMPQSTATSKNGKKKKKASFVQPPVSSSGNNSRLSSLTSQTSGFSSRLLHQKVGSLQKANSTQRIQQPMLNQAPAHQTIDQQLYDQAYQIALKKVYGNDTNRASEMNEKSQGGKLFKSYSLRGNDNEKKPKKKERKLDVDSDEEDSQINHHNQTSATPAVSIQSPRLSSQSDNERHHTHSLFGSRIRSSSFSSSSSSIFRAISGSKNNINSPKNEHPPEIVKDQPQHPPMEPVAQPPQRNLNTKSSTSTPPTQSPPEPTQALEDLIESNEEKSSATLTDTADPLPALQPPALLQPQTPLQQDDSTPPLLSQSHDSRQYSNNSRIDDDETSSITLQSDAGNFTNVKQQAQGGKTGFFAGLNRPLPEMKFSQFISQGKSKQNSVPPQAHHHHQEIQQESSYQDDDVAESLSSKQFQQQQQTPASSTAPTVITPQTKISTNEGKGKTNRKFSFSSLFKRKKAQAV